MLKNKYKERTPEETIAIIKQFFKDKNYITKVTNNSKSEAGTYYCSILLYKNNYIIMQTNGKGATELFSIASGYAELYERFCNMCEHIRNIPFTSRLIQTSYKKNGYYFHPKEKILTFQEVINDPAQKNFFNTLLHTEDNMKTYLDIITDGLYIGEPYINLSTNEIMYYDRRILNRIVASNGMAAGNTLEEALNQGISELAERLVTKWFFEKEQKQYYLITHDSINSSIIKTIINNIEEQGNKVYIFDLSYNFNLPVIMTLIINQQEKCTNINFGSFPIFEIAVERTLTEIYQGIDSLSNIKSFQTPFKIQEFNNIVSNFKNSLSGLSFIDETILLSKKHYVNKCSNIFLENNSTNIEINNYLIELFKNQNYNLTYIDHSLIPDMYAIHVFISNIDNLDKDYYLYKYMNDSLITTYLAYLNNKKIYCNNIIGSIFNIDQLFNNIAILKKFTENSWFDGKYLGKLEFGDMLHFVPSKNKIPIIFSFNNSLEQTQAVLNDTIFYEAFKTYLTIKNYVDTNQYSTIEIKEIVNILYCNVSTEYIENIYNDKYIFEQIYINSIRQYYNSSEYEEMITSFLQPLDINQ